MEVSKGSTSYDNVLRHIMKWRNRNRDLERKVREADE